MARFLLTTWEGGGHVQPLMLVARGLVDRGHDVLVMSDACNAAEAAAIGLAFRPWRHAPSRTDKSPESDPIRDWEARSPMEVIQGLCDALIAGPAAAYARDVADALSDFPAQCVVTEELLFGVMAAAEARGLPLAVMTANIWSLPTLPGAPPFGAGMPPAQNDDDLAFFETIARATRAGYQVGLPALNSARSGLGLAPLDDLFGQLDAAARILLATSRAFDVVKDLPSPFTYVGPYLADPVWAQPWKPSWPVANQDPLILVTFSSMYQGQDEVIRRAIEALAVMPVRGLVTLGPVLQPADFAAPDNVSVVASAPHSQILPHCAAVITHCGHASTLLPLMQGVPLLCIPMGRDQDDNAARVVASGAGLRLPRDAGAPAIQEALGRLLLDPGYRASARRLGDAITADVAARSAEAELEALVA